MASPSPTPTASSPWATSLTPHGDLEATPQHLAYVGNLNVVRGQIEAGTVVATTIDADGRTLLHWACAGGHLDLTNYLLRLHGVADLVNHKDDSGMTALVSATTTGNAALVETLLGAGASANIPTDNGTIALHYHKGRAHVIEALLPHTADINTADKLGQTALHRAAGPGHVAAARVLLHAGAAVDARDKFGNTPLLVACEEGRVEVVKLLLEHGARTDLVNSEGKTALTVCSDPRTRAAVAAAAADGRRE